MEKNLEKNRYGTSLAVQWLRLHASTAGGTGSIPGWGSSTCHTVRPKKKNIHIYMVRPLKPGWSEFLPGTPLLETDGKFLLDPRL